MHFVLHRLAHVTGEHCFEIRHCRCEDYSMRAVMLRTQTHIVVVALLPKCRTVDDNTHVAQLAGATYGVELRESSSAVIDSLVREDLRMNL